MIKVKSKITNREDVLMEVTITMTVGEWTSLMRQLPAMSPSWKLSNMIAELVGKTNVDLKIESELDAS